MTSIKLSSEVKLTDKQLETILSMRNGAALQRGMLTGSWYLGSDIIRSEDPRALLKAGLIEKVRTDLYQLTETGRTIPL